MTTKTLIFVVLTLTSLSYGEPLTDWRTWTSSQGTEVEGRLLSYETSLGSKAGKGMTMYGKTQLSNSNNDGVLITLELRNGTKKSLNTNLLIKSDHQLVKDLMENTIQTKDGSEPIGEIEIVKPAKKIDSSKLFLIPETWKTDRSQITNLGTFDDRASDFERAFANHLYWFSLNGSADLGSSKKAERKWEKALSLSKRLQPNSHRQSTANMATALKDVESPVSHLTRQELATITLESVNQCAVGTTLFIIQGMGSDGKKTFFTYSLPVFEANNNELTIAYREERVKVKFEIITEGSALEKGAWLRADPADQSGFASQLREDDASIRIIDAYAYGFKFP